MSVGFAQTAADVNARTGQLALTLRDTLTQIKNFKLWLDAITDTQLGAPPFSYSSGAGGDIGVLRSSFVDLAAYAGKYTANDHQDASVNGYSIGEANTATATTAASLTRSGATWVTNAWAGRIVVAASGVYGNIASNTATVLTIDQWSNAATPGGSAGTTPAGTTTYTILPLYDYRTFAKFLTGVL
jgi:hypothetical protein